MGRRALAVALAGGAALLGLALYLRDPAGAGGLFPPCPSRALLGLHCPGCGTLRATHRLLHGELWAAFRMNPVAVALGPLVLLALAQARWPGLWPAGRAERARPRAVLALALVLLAYGLLRNVPAEPLAWLAPRSAPLVAGR